MTISRLISVCANVLWKRYIVRYSRNKKFYPYLYRSCWHYKFSSNKQTDNPTCRYSARPNPGAGIGHQLANWIAGYWFAKQFGLKFAHLPFSTQKWEDFFGFGKDEEKVSHLMKNGYKIRKLPLFDEYNLHELLLQKNIIHSYTGRKVIFIAEQDQFYHDQFGVMDNIKRKFYSAEARKADKLIYLKEHFNIAVHIRRGDIVVSKRTNNPNLQMRWQENDYFKNVLSNTLKNLNVDKPVSVFLFSQGIPDDFREFSNIPNLHFCLDMDAPSSFLHLVYADLLITAKSSFSYKPALLNKGIKICPKNFWHGYPDEKDWILADDNGDFEQEIINL
jgi:hypothetical protein